MSVRREVHLLVPPEAVWPHLTDPALLGSWLGADVDLELRQGAKGSVRFADGEVRRVLVERADAPRRIVLRWWAMRLGTSSTEVAIELQPVPGGTVLTVTETARPRLGTGRTLTHA